MTELRIARLTSLAEFDACVDLQQQTWQYSAGEALPRRVFFLAQKLGGLVLGAWDGDTLAAFNLGLPAQRGGIGYLHSQMLAVLPQYRNSGLGRSMKLAQRDFALEQGIDVVEWTYDPLEIKNSFFNLSRLGAISRRYEPDFYGASSSPLQGGLPTDRLYAEWWLHSDHANRVLQGGGNHRRDRGDRQRSRPDLCVESRGRCTRPRGANEASRKFAAAFCSGSDRARVHARAGRQRHVPAWKPARADKHLKT